MKIKIGDMVKSLPPCHLGIVIDEFSYYKGSNDTGVVKVYWFSKIEQEYDKKPSACNKITDVNKHRINLISGLTT